MADFYDYYNETQAFDGGQEVTILRGKPNIDTPEGQLAAKRYEVNSALSLQLEHEAMTDMLIKENPTGLGYRDAHDKYLQGRIKEVLNGAMSEESAVKLTHTLGNFYQQASRGAANEETKLIRNSSIHSLNESVTMLEQQARKDPNALDDIRQQNVDVFMELGTSLGWNDDELVEDLQKADKKLVKSALMGELSTDPKGTVQKLRDGAYSGVLSDREVKEVFKQASKFQSAKLQIQQLPPITELINKGRSLVNSGNINSQGDLRKMMETKKLSRPEYEIAQRELMVEESRMGDPNYSTAKELLMKSEPRDLSPEERDARLRRLQQFKDTEQLNQQTIDQINRETKDKSMAKLNQELQSSRYVEKSIEEAKVEDLKSAKDKLLDDLRSGRINKLEAAKQLRILNNVRKAL